VARRAGTILRETAGRTAAGLPPETPAARARRARAIARRLARRYPSPRIPLYYRTPFQLLVATILSAQSTDATVNRVTKSLFQRYRSPADFAAARREDLERAIHSTGFFRAKARAIQNMARLLLERHGGEVPRTMGELTKLPGVGRKTANVVLSIFGVPGIVVDTHVRRVSRRLALTAHHDPEKIEQDLMVLIPRAEWSAFSLRLIYFGREVCLARAPRCPSCPLRDLCPSARYNGTPPWMSGRPAGSPTVARGRSLRRASPRGADRR
jgi:endonuclease III